MNQPKPKIVDPAIDDMLTSIRDAIHEETAREAEEHARTFKAKPTPGNLQPQARHSAAQAPSPGAAKPGSSVSGSMRELRVSLQPAGQSHSRGTITARSEDFLSLKNKLASLRQSPPEPASGGNMESLLSGDVRLEEAVERMNTAEQLQRQNTPVPPRAEIQPRPESDGAVEMRGATLDDLPGEPSDISYSEHQAADEAYATTTEADTSRTVAPEIVARPAERVTVVQELVETARAVEADEIPSQFVDHTALHHEPIEPAAIAPAPVQAEAIQPAPIQPAPVQPAPIAVEPAMVQVPHNRQLPMHADAAAMMSGEAMRAAGSAFERLSDQLFSKTSGGAQVLEDSARDMIKPMLKRWLDDNLPSLVERLVREEIERVVRKGGR